jgi:acetyl esterase
MTQTASAALDSEIATVLEMLKNSPPMESLEIGALRASVVPVPPETRPTVGNLEDRILSGGLPIRIYQPPTPRCDSLILFFHGGGFVLGSIETHDHVARGLCIAAGCAVVSLDYRLAPEHRFPAATDDCLAAARWARHNAASLGSTARRIVLAGDSAGGNLATVTALRLREGGFPQVSGQILGTGGSSPRITVARERSFWASPCSDPDGAV